MRHLLGFKGFSINESETIRSVNTNKFYHFSESQLEAGDILKNGICENQIYLDVVMPIYREVAKENGFEWPICHGYCFTGPKFILAGDPTNFKETHLKDTVCYEVEADADFHIGAIDRSSQYITMLLENGSISKESIKDYAKQYFMTPPTTYKEAICSKFRVVRALDRTEWDVERVSY